MMMIVDLAMRQIPPPTERISSSCMALIGVFTILLYTNSLRFCSYYTSVTAWLTNRYDFAATCLTREHSVVLPYHCS